MTATLTDLARLHRGILDDPADDTLRLIYADCLEESGDLVRAEFIRLQLQLARMDGRDCQGYYCDVDAESGIPIHRGCRWERMSLREHELLRQGYFAWSPFDHELHKQHHQAISYHRGFVDAVSLPLKAFMDHAASLFAAHPITHVTLSDRTPEPFERYIGINELNTFYRWTWAPDGAPWDSYFGAYPYCIPEGIYRKMREEAKDFRDLQFVEEKNAQALLARGSVAYGREAAKLPKYPTANPTLA